MNHNLLSLPGFFVNGWTPSSVSPFVWYRGDARTDSGGLISALHDKGSAGIQGNFPTGLGHLASSVLNGQDGWNLISPGILVDFGTTQMVDEAVPFATSGVVNAADWRASTGGPSYFQFFVLNAGVSSPGISFLASDLGSFPTNPGISMLIGDNMTHFQGAPFFDKYSTFFSFLVNYNGGGWGNPSSWEIWIDGSKLTIQDYSAVTTIGNNATNNLLIVGSGSAPLNTWCEWFIIQGSELSGVNLASLWKYYAARYGLTTSWTPLTPGLVTAWFDAAQYDGSTTWTDLGPNGYHATAHNGPTLVPNVLNGQPAVRLVSASNQYLDFAQGTYTLPAGQDGTIVVVTKAAAALTSGNFAVILAAATQATGYCGIYNANSGGYGDMNFAGGDGGSHSYLIVPTFDYYSAFYGMVMEYNGGSFQDPASLAVYKNFLTPEATSVGGGSGTINSGTLNTIGAWPDAIGSLNYDGDILEIIIYAKRLSDYERQQLAGYLNLKYGNGVM